MVCLGICGSVLSCVAHALGTCMSKTLTYDPRVDIPSISVHLRGMIKRVFVPFGKGLKLIRQFTVYIGIHIHCSHFD